MKSESLSSVVQNVIEDDRLVGKNLVEAYRVGGTFACGTLDKRVQAALVRVPLLNDAVKTYVSNASKRLTQLVGKSVAAISDGADSVIDRVSDGATGALTQVASRAEGVDNKYAVQYVQLVSKLSMPGAKLAQNVSGRMAEGSTKLSDFVTTRAATKKTKGPKQSLKRKARAAKSASEAAAA